MKSGFHCGRFLVVLGCVLTSSIAWGGTTWYVGSPYGSNFKTIQAAVDAAAGGDTIILRPGTHTGPGNRDIDLRGKALAIQSLDPLDPNVTARTIIDCAGAPKEPHRAFYVTDCDGVTLSGLTITNGLALAGGGIFCTRSTLDLRYCRILDNATLPGDAAGDPGGGPGGGLYCENSTVRVVGCLVQGNGTGGGVLSRERGAGAGGNGGGICSVDSNLSVVSCTLSDNAAGVGGDDSQGPAGNGGDGGGLCANAVKIVDSTFCRNTAGAGGQGTRSGRGGRGGGVFADTAVLDRCTIEADRAGDGGRVPGGVKSDGGSGGGDGGGVYGDSLEITNSLITGNRAGRGYAADASGSIVHGDGGGIWCAAGAIRHCTVAGNVVCRTQAGASASSGRGAGVFCTPRVTVTSSAVGKNTPDQIAGQDCRKVAYNSLGASVCSTTPGNISGEPAFVRDGRWVNGKDFETAAEPDDPDALWLPGDYHLRATSPLLDAGAPDYVPAADETDLGGGPRLADAAVDVGAYESRSLVPVYRFWSGKNRKHFYTLRESERDKLIHQQADVWAFEGIAFYAFVRPSERDLLPVYRFWSPKLSSHFYTIKESERAKLANQPGTWTPEGVAFYAYPEGPQPAGAKAVYRFWSDRNQRHFYTISEAERDKLIRESASGWTVEGVAWYTYAQPPVPEGLSVPGATVYLFSGGPEDALCMVSLKAFLDGKEARIDKPDLLFNMAAGTMRMAVNLDAGQATLADLMVETKPVRHAVTIGSAESDGIEVPIVLSSSARFLAPALRGPYGIDSRSLTFPTTGSGRQTGGVESFTVGGVVTVDGRKLDIGYTGKATQFTAAGLGTFKTSALPDRLNVVLPETFQWSRQKQQDLLLETTVKGSTLKLYITGFEVRTMGVWEGAPLTKAGR
jgi:hypothetical protein